MKESTHMANMAKVTSQIRPRPMKIFAPGFGAGSSAVTRSCASTQTVVVVDSKVKVRVSPGDGQSGETGSEGIATAFAS